MCLDLLQLSCVLYNADAAAENTKARIKMKPEGEHHDQGPKRSAMSICFLIIELVLRVVAIVATLGSALAMGLTDETLPFSTQGFVFKAKYDDIPTFRFVMICASFPFCFHIVCE